MTFRHLRFPFLAMLALFMVIALSSCSKKDVVQEEPGFSPSEGMDMGMGAGDSYGGSPELQTVYFEFDSYALSSEGREALKANAQWLTENPNATVQLEGHCDERGTTEYNLALGERRANAARDYLERLGVDGSRLSVISYGEERPLDPGTGEAAWAKNRRAQFVILSR